ncbi:MAG TPA: ROK family protein [Ktedonobacteraceae bacterium]|nr:ROK family protein [Ktedonobacteraceae bacterium]
MTNDDSREANTHDFVIAIDFGGTKIALATTDMTGSILKQARLDTNASQGAQQVLERTTVSAQALIERTASEVGGQCVEIGVVTPGVVHDDGILLSPNIPGWEQVPLRETIHASLHIPTVVGNDVKAAAMAEMRWGALKGADPAVYLSLGTGVAAAIVIGGRVITGAHGASGEFGYNLRSVLDTAGAAQGHAPLEEAIGGRFIGERGSLLLGESLSAADVFAHTDMRARFLVDETLAELATHVANLAILIDPARIAVGGGLMSSGEIILRALAFRLEYAVPFPPEIVPARFLNDASLYGAIALALTTVD